VREIERGRHDDLGQPAGFPISGTKAVKQCAARLHEAGQHDEEVASDERGDERVARLAQDVPCSNRGARRPVLGAPTIRPSGHLKQLDEPVCRPFKRRCPLAEKQPGEDAQSEAGEDLARGGQSAETGKARW
jgi:hypothetical protein